MTFAFAAAGTGGHVYPALAVADALVAQGVANDEIVFFGGDRMEATTVPDAGYQFEGVEIHGLRRSLSVGNLRLPNLVRRAAASIGESMERRGTKVATAFGGYVSVPAALAARRTGATLFVHEQNAVPGLANKLISRGAKTNFLAFPAAATVLKNTRVVGNPLRVTLQRFDRAALRSEARRRYDLPNDVTVLGVLGGSLGAQVLNDMVIRIADDVDSARVAIVHLTGTPHYEAVTAEADRFGAQWTTVAFEREMEYFYAAVDLVLGRAGALTISELAVTATPAVVVPLAAVAQEANAAFLDSAGAVLAIPQAEIEQVPVEIEQLLADPPRRAQMAEAAGRLATPHAADEIAAALIEEAS